MSTTRDLEHRTTSDVNADSRGVGLHGHRFDTRLVQVAAVEALGTFVLVLAIIGAAIPATLRTPIAGDAFGSAAVPLAGGIALALLVGVLGAASGAHLNPAVTVGLAALRRFPWVRVPAYVAAQLSGAIAAALVAWWFYGAPGRDVAHLGAPAPGSGFGTGRAFGAEAVLTGLLVFVVVVIGSDPKRSSQAPFAIGAALSVAILVSGPISGGALNPARALGPMIVAESYHDWWLYVLAPVVGATVATAVAAWLEHVRSSAVPTATQSFAGSDPQPR